MGFNATGDEAQLDLPPSRTSHALERAHKAIKRGRQLIAERQKLIRIADRSDLGWSVVSEYTVDELAEDSEDEKRLEKAERSAERKLAKRKKKRTEPTVGRQAAHLIPKPVAAIAGSSGIQTSARRPPSLTPQTFRVPGPCFACGKMGNIGHIAQSWPAVLQWTQEVVSFTRCT